LKINEIKRQARRSLKGKWGFAILLVIITFGINSIVPFLINTVLDGGISYNNTSFGSNISNILSIFVLPITTGCSWVFLSLVRGESTEIGHLFRIFKDGKRYLKSIGLTLLVLLLTLLWGLLLLIPGIIKGLAYSQVNYLYKDHPEYSIPELITASRKLMYGYKWKFFLLNLSFIGWGILSLFTLGIGLLWLIPYINSSLAEFYHQRTAIAEKKSEIII
jgi:uncharacterized membrane protein